MTEQGKAVGRKGSKVSPEPPERRARAVTRTLLKAVGLTAPGPLGGSEEIESS